MRSLIVRYDLRHRAVARHAGVSRVTVGQLLAAEEDGREIRPETRKRYLAAIEKARQDVLRRVEVAVS